MKCQERCPEESTGGLSFARLRVRVPLPTSPFRKESVRLIVSLLARQDSTPAFLSGVGMGSANFHFHLVFLPAACFLSGEEFSVVAVVAWVAAIECRVINLLPYPSLPGHNRRVAVSALGRAADDHVILLKTSTHNETRFSLCSVGAECKECVLSSSFVCGYGQCERGRLT
jgi:hypothetical protein